ncbi:valine--tRNA ligase, mitochondrial [Cinclus cinclus]|uniref:valine--tRNA ligase, mitochondrial n=1 Tax=Cinclus cinclus TaxID=127875 RepID=UPI002E0F2A22
MAAPSLSRGAFGAPRILGGPGGGRVRVRAWSTGTPSEEPPQAGETLGNPAWDPSELARLRGREQREKRQRLKRERAEGRAAAGQEPSPLPKGWTPKAEVEYRHPLGPDGKKATQVPLPPQYSPRYVESAWYQWWERGGVFSPPEQAPGGSPVLSLVLPPPNVTGSLHLGHALTVTLQDILVRWRRMQGWSVLWVPGTDHAGIATQAVVERWLWRHRRQRRQDLGRAEFLREVWRWKERHGDEILGQLRALGASLDWSRCAFTMDPAFSRAVTEAFVRLFRAGLIRRDQRVVTWSCALGSALADVEVEPRVLSGPTELNVPNCPQPVTFGLLVTFAYPVEGDDGLELPVATTRPETIFGDVAVAVNPKDPRYLHLHGRRVRHPFSGALLPVVTDSSVQPEMGTGAVKVTPGHSPQDLALARAHALPLLSVIGDNGTLCPPGGGWLQGVPRFEARARVVAALAQLGLFRGVQDHAMTLPLCSRSGDVVEFLLKRQWFLSCGDMARGALQAVTSGRLHLVPKFHEKNWKTWMENVGDWCLSRQLWWGHQVPAYQVRGGTVPTAAQVCAQDTQVSPQEGPWFVGRSEAEARAEAARILGCSPGQVQLQQDPDVLDTWFSSALFPFAALGWPEQSPDFGRFYPNSVLVTGSDLLFFWVARMAMLGQQLTGQLPFSQVLLHSLVRDSQGRKMSKSLGNVIDPRDVIGGATLQELQEKLQSRTLDPQELQVAQEGQRQQFPQGIPECGADALRLALSSHNVHGPEIRVGVASVLTQRRFCNKVWNGVGFVLRALEREGGTPKTPPEEVAPVAPLDRWLLSRLAAAVAACCRHLEALQFQGAAGAVQNFWVRNFCDVYLEVAKVSLLSPSLRPGVLATLVAGSELGLRLLAPFAPFLAEELWQRLPRAPPAPPTLCRAPFPDPQKLARWHSPELETQVAAMLELVRAVRGLRETFGLRGASRPPVLVQCQEPARDWLEPLGSAFQALSGAGPVQLLPPGAEPGPGWAGAPAASGTFVHLRIQGLVDPGPARAQLRARLTNLERRLRSLGGAREPLPGTAQHHQAAVLRADLARLEQALQALETPGDPSETPPGIPSSGGGPGCAQVAPPVAAAEAAQDEVGLATPWGVSGPSVEDMAGMVLVAFVIGGLCLHLWLRAGR